MAKKGALAKDPTVRSPGSRTPTGSSKWVRIGAGQYKDQYGNVKKGQQKRPTKDMSQKQPASAPTTPLQPPPPSLPTLPELTEEGLRAGAGAYGDIVNYFRGFDPYQMQAKYQPGFETEMEKARQNIMGTFERRNQEEFQRQQEDVQRQIAERGLDPASPAAQGLYKQLNVRQDLARQEALSAAEQAAYGVQEQGFGQAYKTAMAPYAAFPAIQDPYMAGIGAQYQGQQLTQQQQFEARQNQLARQAQERIARMSRGGGGGIDPATAAFNELQFRDIANRYTPQQPKPNPNAQLGQGIAQGGAQAVNQYLLRPTGQS